MGAPGADHHIRPVQPCTDCHFVFGPLRVSGLSHHPWVGGANAKDIGGLKATKSQRAGAALAALNRGVILYFGGLRWIEHHKHHPLTCRIPHPGQAIAKGFTVGIDGSGGRVALGMAASNHRFVLPAPLTSCKLSRNKKTCQATAQSGCTKTRLGCSSPAL